MAKKRKFKDVVQPIRPDLHARFLAVMQPKAGASQQQAPAAPAGEKVAGFHVKNTNALWRWDTLEDC